MALACVDSWAILWLMEGSGRAQQRLAQRIQQNRPVMSWMNAGEVFYVVRRAHDEAEAQRVLRDLRGTVDLDETTPDRVLAAARIKSDHRVAFADAFAAATAMAYDAVLLTGDPELLITDAPWRAEDLR